MHAVNTPSRLTACRTCGAYGGSQHQFSCQQDGRIIPQGRMRGAARDARLSAVVRETAGVQDDAIRNL